MDHGASNRSQFQELRWFVQGFPLSRFKNPFVSSVELLLDSHNMQMGIYVLLSGPVLCLIDL